MSQVETIATLRAVVGYLGERDQFAWWPSTFFGASSKAFLTPVFERTWTLAQCSGVTRAAARVHDNRIGIGNVYHLFRLPEDIELGIHRALQDQALCAEIASVLVNKDTALAYLSSASSAPETPGIGPTRVGSIRQLRRAGQWVEVATRYAHAFGAGSQVYPYFADRA